MRIHCPPLAENWIGLKVCGPIPQTYVLGIDNASESRFGNLEEGVTRLR